MKKEELKDKILAEYEKGNIVYSTSEGLSVASLEEFVKQPTSGMLYDLNRLPEVVLTFIDDPKWVNDYAVAVVITKLKEKIATQGSVQNSQTTNPMATALSVFKRELWAALRDKGWPNQGIASLIERLNNALQNESKSVAH